MTGLPAFTTTPPPCTSVDPELFFPHNRTEALHAKQICAACPTADPCLQYALDIPQYGIWGGTSTRERIEIVRGLGRPYNPNWTPPVAAADLQPESQRRRELRAGAPRNVRYTGLGGHDRMLADVAAAHARGLTRGQITVELGLSERKVREALRELTLHDDARAAS